MKTLSVALSEQCNLNCGYCNVDKRSKDRIDADLFIDQYKVMRQQYPDEQIQIDFYGGEPLLQYDLIQRIIEATSGDDNVKYYMPTNGLLLNQERLDYFKNYNITISLSFDGLWQDTNRLQLNGKLTQKKYLSKKNFFKQIPTYQIHSMVSAGNYNLLENHLYILKNMDANPNLTFIRDRGIWDSESVEKVKEGISELFDWYKQNADTEEMPNIIKEYLRHIILYKAKGYETKTCGAGVDFFSFSENKLVPCNRYKDEPDVIAKIPEYTVMNKCTTCEVRNYCRKGCLYEQIKNEGPVDELCDIYKHMYAEIFKMLAELKNNSSLVSIVKKEVEYECS